MTEQRFGEAFKQIRLEMNLTQEEAAERIGVTRQTIILWESGKSTPPINPVVTRDQALSRLILTKARKNQCQK